MKILLKVIRDRNYLESPKCSRSRNMLSAKYCCLAVTNCLSASKRFFQLTKGKTENLILKYSDYLVCSSVFVKPVIVQL